MDHQIACFQYVSSFTACIHGTPVYQLNISLNIASLFLYIDALSGETEKYIEITFFLKEIFRTIYESITAFQFYPICLICQMCIISCTPCPISGSLSVRLCGPFSQHLVFFILNRVKHLINLL